MKKLVIVIALLVALIVPLAPVASVSALETNTYTCTASNWSQRCEIDFTTNIVGPLTVNVQWDATAKGKYSLDVYNQETAQWCAINTSDGTPPPAGNWTCHFDNADAGLWHIYFNPYKGGSVTATVTVTGETNP